MSKVTGGTFPITEFPVSLNCLLWRQEFWGSFCIVYWQGILVFWHRIVNPSLLVFMKTNFMGSTLLQAWWPYLKAGSAFH